MFSDASSYDDDEEDRWLENEEMWSDIDEDELFDRDEELLTSDTSVDMIEIERLADRKIVFHRSVMLGSHTVDFHIAALLLESELSLNNHDYQSSLICAVGAEQLAGNSLGAAQMISMICLYQMGDRSRAEELMNQIRTNPPPSCQISPYLMKKFNATCEVLTFMPQLLSMLRAAEKKPSRTNRRRY